MSKYLQPVCTWGDLSIQNKAHAPGRYWYHFSSSSGCQKWTENHMQVPRRLRFVCRPDLLEAAFTLPWGWTTAEAALRWCCQGLQHHQWCCGTLRAGQPAETQPFHQAPCFAPCHRLGVCGGFAQFLPSQQILPGNCWENVLSGGQLWQHVLWTRLQHPEPPRYLFLPLSGAVVLLCWVPTVHAGRSGLQLQAVNQCWRVKTNPIVQESSIESGMWFSKVV